MDNSSTDGSVEFIKTHFPTVCVVELGKNVGYARGMNAGLEYAVTLGFEYVLIMNNDTLVATDALRALVRTAQTELNAGFVSGKVYFYDQPDIFHTVGKKEDAIRWNGAHLGWFEKDVGQYDTVSERIFLDDVMILVSRRVYEEVGGYDPQFFLQAAEFDWQARAKMKGWKCYYTPNAKIWHRVSMTLGGFGNPIGRYFDTRGSMVVMARHRTLAQFIKYYLYTGFQVTNLCLRGLVQLNWIKFKSRFSMLLGFVSGTFWLFHRRPARKVPWIIDRLK